MQNNLSRNFNGSIFSCYEIIEALCDIQTENTHLNTISNAVPSRQGKLLKMFKIKFSICNSNKENVIEIYKVKKDNLESSLLYQLLKQTFEFNT